MQSNIIIRLICAVLIASAGAFTGHSISCAESRRAVLLAETMDSLQILRIHMLESLLPLNTAFCRAGGYILTAAGELMKGISAGEAWHELCSTQCTRGQKLDSLTAADKEALNRFFIYLGKTAREEQAKNFETTLKELGILENMK